MRFRDVERTSDAPKAEPSWLLRYLPGIYADDPFMGSFLRIFEGIWSPLDRQLDQMHRYFDPCVTPSEFLPWLGTWLDLVLDENWPEARRRALIQNAADLYRRRGTVGGLRDYLTLCTGVKPEIIEEADVPNPYHFTVRFRVQDRSLLDEERVTRIINEEKPAHTTYTLQIAEEA